MRQILFLTFVLVAACGGNAVVEQGSTGSGGAVSTGSTTSTVTGSSTVTGIGTGDACPDGGMPIPTEFKTCTSSGDCTQHLIYLDCCGSQEAIGVNASQGQALQAFEKACNPHVPACGCPAAPTLAEDGKSALQNASIQVACNTRLCTTFVP